MDRTYNIATFGSNAIRVSWEPIISSSLSEEIIALNTCFKTELKEEILETHFGYHEVVVYLTSAASVVKSSAKIKKILDSNNASQNTSEKQVYTIPVCYDEELAWDLETLCERHEISKSELITYHTAPLYPIHFIGFLPGFPYLGGLDDRIATPRKKTPRTLIPAGAVGIAGMQTGIYPISSPGGWNLIGRTPIRLFDPNAKTPALLKYGNYVKFKSISITAYQNMKEEIKQGTFSLEIKNQK